MQIEHFRSRCLWFIVCAILSGAVLFIFGLCCGESTDIPPPPLANPLPQRVLFGLAFMLLNPVTFSMFSLILTASGFLVSKLSWLSSAAAILVGLTFLLIGAFWVPNPVILWPISILGDHTLPELIGELFTFHIVPSPGGSIGTSAGMDSLVRWQIEECGARFCILMIVWTVCLVTIWIIDRKLRTDKSLQLTAASPVS
jgi:hypothetical protein